MEKVARTWEVQQDIAIAYESWCAESRTAEVGGIELGMWLVMNLPVAERMECFRLMDEREAFRLGFVPPRPMHEPLLLSGQDYRAQRLQRTVDEEIARSTAIPESGGLADRQAAEEVARSAEEEDRKAAGAQKRRRGAAGA